MNLDNGNTRVVEKTPTAGAAAVGGNVSHNVLKEGAIELQNDDEDLATTAAVRWTASWLTLQPDHLVLSNHPTAAGSGGSGSPTLIKLDNISGVVPDLSSEVPNVLLIRTAAPPKTYTMHAANRGDATAWITAIISAQHHIQDRWLLSHSALAAGKGDGTGSSSSGGGGAAAAAALNRLSIHLNEDEDEDGGSNDAAMEDVDLSIAPVMGDPDAVILEGLLKKAGMLKQSVWQPRHFVLKQDTLEYFDPGSLTLKGTIEVKNITGILPIANSGGDGGTTKFAIHAIFPDRVYNLSADSPAIAADWIAALVSAQLLLQDERMYRLRAAEMLVSGSVTGREVMNDGSGKGRYTQYLIELETSEGTCTLTLRYSELRKLYECLKAKFTDDTFPFPSKKFLGLGDNFGSGFLKARQAKLHEFVSKIVGERPFCDHELVRRFFFDRKL